MVSTLDWDARLQINYLVELEEVLKTLQLSRDDSAIPCYSPKKFPLTEDTDGVQFRKNAIAPYRLSKTTDFDLCRNPTGSHLTYQDFEVKGCAKIEVLDKSFKLKKNEFIRYQNGNVYRCESKKRETLKENVHLKSARLLTKREVELRDDNNLIFTLTFDSSKDAKLFLESDKLSSYVNNDDHKSSVKKKLYRLLGKRSSREVLEKKGIYQNEPIFGNTLKDIYNNDRGVPKFILKTMELIERPENITSLGIYRTSGNLATIQKIRFEVDKGRLEILDDFAKDVDVLTGSLKLFFRELKEPLISCDACDQLLTLTRADKQYTKKDKDKIKSVLHHLPEANWETLRVLLKHLTEVAKYKEQNKMDTYNLSVCWGPTVIFATETIDSTNYKDIVTQSTEATRMFESLLLFFINNPEELDMSNKKQDSLDRNRNLIFRVDSIESVKSSDSNTSKGTTKKSGSNLSLDIDEVIRKMVELIEYNCNLEGLYRKSGASDKILKISKKLTKKKLIELDKYKTDGLELCTSFRNYLQVQEPLVTQQVVEQVVNYCDNAHVREHNTRQKIILALQDLPKRDTFIFLLKHILVVLEHEPFHKVPRSEIISIWASILNQNRKADSEEKFYNFLRIVLEAFDEKQPDIMGYPWRINNGLLNDLKNHHRERDRTSKYDNVPDDVEIYHEAIFLEEKTEHLENTKL